MKTTKGFILTTKYLVITGVFLVLVNATLGLVLANLADSAIKSLISSWMLDISNTAAALLDGDTLKEVSLEDKGTPEYESVMKTLTGFQYSMGMSYIYLVQDLGDKNFVFGLDPTIEDADDYGTPVAYTEALYTASQGTPAASLIPYEDAWGWFYSAYSPVFDSAGNVASIVTVDFSKEWYDEQIVSFMLTTVIVIAASLIIGGTIVVVFARKYRKNINVVSEQINRLEDRTENYAAELSVATKIQTDILPRDFPKDDRVELFAAMTPAKEVGGDFYDFFFVDDDHIALVMADVAGKGVPAALFSVVAKTIIRDKVMLGGDPASILFDVNNILCQNNSAGFFITVWLGILDLGIGVVEYVNAGHEYPIVGVKGKSVEVIRKDNCPPLAAIENTEFVNEKIRLFKGDTLFLYTDGLTEAKADDGSRFGMDRLVKLIGQNEGRSPEETVTSLKQEVDSFQSGNDPFDDVTIMSVVWKGNSTERRPHLKELKIEAKKENLAEVFTFLQDALGECGAPKKLIRQIKLCVEEIFINIASYAYTPDTGQVRIVFDTSGVPGGEQPLRAVITFIDSGKPYDPLAKEDPDLELGLDEVQIGGLGIYIVKETMDDLGYERRDGQNIFTMEKIIDVQTG